MKQLTPAALVALKEALIHIYWYKKDLKIFLLESLSRNIDINSMNWDLTKRELCSLIIDRLVQQNKTESLLQLTENICQFENFQHLMHLEDGANKARIARDAVIYLRELFTPYQESKKSEEERKKRIKSAEDKRLSFKNYQEELANLRNEFISLVSSQNHQQRGFKLEQLMNKLFTLNDLDPKASFKIMGQQIDGAFTLDGTEFLFEAKWTKSLINNSDLAAFKEKVKSKLENTLGLFLSIDGFSEDGITASQYSDKVMILMDGSDLMAVLEERISFTSLINRKKQIASREGKIYVPFSQMRS